MTQNKPGNIFHPERLNQNKSELILNLVYSGHYTGDEISTINEGISIIADNVSIDTKGAYENFDVGYFMHKDLIDNPKSVVAALASINLIQKSPQLIDFISDDKEDINPASINNLCNYFVNRILDFKKGKQAFIDVFGNPHDEFSICQLTNAYEILCANIKSVVKQDKTRLIDNYRRVGFELVDQVINSQHFEYRSFMNLIRGLIIIGVGTDELYGMIANNWKLADSEKMGCIDFITIMSSLKTGSDSFKTGEINPNDFNADKCMSVMNSLRTNVFKNRNIGSRMITELKARYEALGLVPLDISLNSIKNIPKISFTINENLNLAFLLRRVKMPDVKYLNALSLARYWSEIKKENIGTIYKYRALELFFQNTDPSMKTSEFADVVASILNDIASHSLDLYSNSNVANGISRKRDALFLLNLVGGIHRDMKDNPSRLNSSTQLLSAILDCDRVGYINLMFGGKKNLFRTLFNN